MGFRVVVTLAVCPVGIRRVCAGPAEPRPARATGGSCRSGSLCQLGLAAILPQEQQLLLIGIMRITIEKVRLMKNPGLLRCAGARAAKKNHFAKSKISNFFFFQNFFPPRRQATLSWLGGFALMQRSHKGHQEPGISWFFTRGRAHRSRASA